VKRTFNLADLFEIVAAAVPDRDAFICGDLRLSFRELDERATRLASAMRESGVVRGNNVGIQLYNSAEYLETFFACCKIGAVPVNINYRYLADELTYIANSLELRVLVYGGEFGVEVGKMVPRADKLALLVRVGAAGSGDPAQALAYETLLASGAATLNDPERSDQDLYILCTGGTTGMPKGVMWTHKALLMAALGGGGIYFRRPPIATPDELTALVKGAPPLSFFAAAPMMHGAANWAALISLLAGHAVVVNDQKNFDAEHIWDLIERHRVNIISIVGDAMALPMIQALEKFPGRWNLQSMMVFGNGGAAFSAHLQERVKAQLPAININNGMGSSESGVIGGTVKNINGEGLIRIEPRPDIAVIDDDQQIVTAVGGQGTLARTGHTPIGYYGDPKKTAEVFVTINGQLWLLTGDRARIDESGDIVVLGRGSQCINTGGEKVFTEEVEGAVRRYPAVHDVLVVGLPDERWGQKVAAVVEVAPDLEFSAEELQHVCRQYLSGYKLPRAVFVSQKIQRSPAGKADYRWAKEFALNNTSLI